MSFLVVCASIAFLAGLIRSSKERTTFKDYVLCYLVRTFNSNVTIRQNQYLRGDSLVVYHTFAQEALFTLEVVRLEDKTEVCWLGSPDTVNTLLWLHGGTYTSPAGISHMKLLQNFISKANTQGNKLSVLILSYDLAPFATYPAQLGQAESALTYLLETVGRLASQIILGGDSAGGNLALALLLHLSHPHPSLIACPPTTVLKSVVLVSPRVTFTQNTPSMKRNATTDFVYLPSLARSSEAYLAGSPVDAYNTPSAAPVGWWKNLRTEGIKLMAGSNECFLDDVKAFG